LYLRPTMVRRRTEALCDIKFEVQHRFGFRPPLHAPSYSGSTFQHLLHNQRVEVEHLLYKQEVSAIRGRSEVPFQYGFLGLTPRALRSTCMFLYMFGADCSVVDPLASGQVPIQTNLRSGAAARFMLGAR